MSLRKLFFSRYCKDPTPSTWWGRGYPAFTDNNSNVSNDDSFLSTHILLERKTLQLYAQMSSLQIKRAKCTTQQLSIIKINTYIATDKYIHEITCRTEVK